VNPLPASHVISRGRLTSPFFAPIVIFLGSGQYKITLQGHLGVLSSVLCLPNYIVHTNGSFCYIMNVILMLHECTVKSTLNFVLFSFQGVQLGYHTASVEGLDSAIVSQRSVIGWVTKIYFLELLRASDVKFVTLSCWSRLHLQSSAHTLVSRRLDVRQAPDCKNNCRIFITT
jgi:hypothetical protein